MSALLYTIQRYCEESKEKFRDGSNIIYVNGNYKGNDKLGRLLHDFKCKDPKKMYHKELAESVAHFKQEEGGEPDMCESVEKYAKEYAAALCVKI